jgi:basic membrane protein A and related proteins
VKVSRKLMVVVLSVASLAVAGAILATGNGQARPAAVRVALVADTGSLNDKGFNTLAVQGLNKAEKDFGVDGRIYQTATAADRTPNLQAAAQAGYGLVIANGVLFTFGPLDTVAPAFPNTKFLGIDVNFPDVTGTPKNIRGVQFREQEAGCLVGNIAALEIKREHKRIISAIGANKVTAIVRFFAGYNYCARRAFPHVRVLNNYAGDPTFNDQTKCTATALSQVARGSRIIFTVAGGCGLGAINVAKSKGVYAIGVDADQSFLGPQVLTSATKHVNVAVYNAIKEYAADPAGFKTGFNQNYTIKNGGVGYGKLSPKLPKAVQKAYMASTNALAKLIASGKVVVPDGS